MHILAKAGEPNPVTEDGTPYPFVLLNADESVGVFADNLHDIVGFIVGNGYIGLNDPERELALRHDAALTFAAYLSQTLYPALDDVIDAGITDEDLLGFYMTRPDFAAETESGDILKSGVDPMFSKLFFSGLDDDREWDYPFPFIGMATDYLPHTYVAPPTGNVLLLDPMDELSFVNSLKQANELLVSAGHPMLVKLFTRDEDDQQG